MPRKSRFETVAPGVPHHVVIRGNNRRSIFSRDSDRYRFLLLLERGLRKSECQLHAVALLPNHVHALITPPSASALAACMQRCCQPYASRRNRQLGASGKLFEERYFAKAIRDERYLAAATAYVDLNPSRAGLGSRLSRWSTLAIHLGKFDETKIADDLWTPSPWYQGLGRDPESRAARYDDWLKVYETVHRKVQENQAIARRSTVTPARRLR